MSSKSKKSAPASGKKPRSTAAAGAESAIGASEKHEIGEVVEEVLHVPTGKSPLRFLLVVLLVIVLTALFAVDPGNLLTAMRGGGGSYMTWNHPSQGEIEVSPGQFRNASRRLNDYMGLFNVRTTAEDTASFLVLDALAQDSGIRITDEELRKRLSELAAAFGDAAALKQFMQTRTEGGIRGFEETMRQKLSGDRYVKLLAFMAATPDPEAIEKVWLAAHQERAFDYLELEQDALTDEARAELPDDAALEQWLAERDEFEKHDFQEPERMRAELVGFLFDGENDAAGLLERYPESAAPVDEHDHEDGHEDGHDHESESAQDAEGSEAVGEAEAAQALAQKYYDGVLYWRFERPVAEGEAPADDFTARYFSFEEVEAIAAREAPVYFAMERWIGDLRKRTIDGEEIDLEAEARSLGLSYRPAVDSLSGEEWSEVSGFGGPSLGIRLSRLAENEFTPGLMIEKGAIMIGRLAEKTASFLPEFAVVRDDVAQAWIDARAGELAVARLAALRDGFEPLPEEPEDPEDPEDDGEADTEPLPHATETEFAEAAAAIGLEVKRRPHMEDAFAMSRDPDAELPGHTYIRNHTAELSSLAEGELAPPGLAADGARAFLVRAAGSRDPEAWKMSPLEYEQSTRVWEYQIAMDFIRDNFSFEALAEKYAISLPRSEE